MQVLTAKTLLAATLAVGALAAAGGAHAQGVAGPVISVTVGAPVRHVQPVAVPVQPRYVQGPAWRQDARGPRGDIDRDGIPNRYDRHDNRRVAAHGAWGDADRDGVPNRYDRAPYNPRWR